jgi:plasmid stabilization system protein ParE
VKTVVWNPAARLEFDDALAQSRDAAGFQRAIGDALDDIAAGRVTHATVPRTPCRRCVLKKPPYSIVYIEVADEIRVVSLPHHKRRTNYWKGRLPKD